MPAGDEALIETRLRGYGEGDWRAALESIWPSIHPVDRTATETWFAFFPLSLLRALEQSENPDQLAAALQLRGRYRLIDQIDSSHWFLYGHRYWPQVKQAVVEHARSGQALRGNLADQIRQLARAVAEKEGIAESLLLGISAIALMTLRQAGLKALRASPGTVRAEVQNDQRTAEQILNARAKDDGQGLFGFLRGEKKLWTVTFDENQPDAKFRLIHSQHLTTAAANDKREYHLRDPRCVKGEGPIPVECRSAACGTCWVGVLGGAEKLSPVTNLEREKIREFGYLDSDHPKPVIRLACMAQAFGAVSIVIPPWNGYFGDYLRKQTHQQ